MIFHRQGHEHFHSAELLFLSPQTHGDGRYEKEKHQRHEAKKTPHGGLAHKEEFVQLEKNEVGYDKKYSDVDVCYGEVEVAFKLFFEDSVKGVHYSCSSPLA